jgi:hypothetical protein
VDGACYLSPRRGHVRSRRNGSSHDDQHGHRIQRRSVRLQAGAETFAPPARSARLRLVFIIPIAPIPVFGIVYSASHGMVPLIDLVGRVAMVFTAPAFMALRRAFPVAGSVYTFAARKIGPAAGNFSGWAILLDYLLIPTLAYVAVAKRSPLICVKPTEGRSRSIFFRDRRP